MKKRENVIGLGVILCGFVFGILFVNFCGDTYFRQKGIISRELWDSIRTADLNTSDYFYYVLKNRLSVFLLLWLLGHTAVGIAAILAWGFWLGCGAGLLLTDAFLHMKLYGILLSLAAVLPQMIFYGISGVWLYGAVWSRKKGVVQGIPERKKWEREYAAVLAMALPVWMAGIFLESYINPVWLKWVLNTIF